MNNVHASTMVSSQVGSRLRYSAQANRHARSVGLWLLICAAMVAAMVVIGAITRLTESGLSIVEWQPLMGALPPLNDAEWQRVFALYQQTPEYRLKNFGMTLGEFQQIFFWEWLHRFWGRLIGVVFALPFLWFLVRGRLSRGLALRLFALLLLGGLQGGLGWLMVKSGLVDRPSVSPYRLAAHLGFALLLYSLLLVQGLALLRRSAGLSADDTMRRYVTMTLVLLAITIFWGALVAGLDAGLAYNTWPLMDGRLLPPESWSIVPAWRNAFENTALVQFLHRWLAASTVPIVIGLAIRGARHEQEPVRYVSVMAGIVVLIQGGLGVATLLTAAPVALAVVHQFGALTLLTLLVWLRFETRRQP